MWGNEWLTEWMSKAREKGRESRVRRAIESRWYFSYDSLFSFFHWLTTLSLLSDLTLNVEVDSDLASFSSLSLSFSWFSSIYTRYLRGCPSTSFSVWLWISPTLFITFLSLADKKKTLMALFFVGYLIAVTSTIAFIVAILTPKWIYPNNLPVDATILASPSESNYRGIFYVDAGYPNATCRDWILTYKDSVAACRPSTLVVIYHLLPHSLCIASSLCRGLCSIVDYRFCTLGYSTLASRRLSLHSSSTARSSFRFGSGGIDDADL